MGAIEPLMESEINYKVRKEALSFLMFLKRKRCGKCKARGCVDGRPQRKCISKEESSSPTVSIYAWMTSCLMDAIEDRHVVTCDIPAAFMQADWPDDRECILRFEGPMVKMICDINPSYKANVFKNKHGKPVLYARLKKAVYGTIMASLLFYEKLRAQLIEWGFTENHYDHCTFNKMVEGKQLTVQYHVDDLKISSTNEEAVNNMIKDLNGKFRTKAKERSISEQRIDT